MIEIVAARPTMLPYLNLQKAQMISGREATIESVSAFILGGMALAAIDGEEVLCMAGFYDLWEDRALAWGLLAEGTGGRMSTIHRVAKRALDVCPVRRIEAYVFAEHDEGHRWAKMLGFAEEGLMRRFWQDQDYSLYARVR